MRENQPQAGDGKDPSSNQGFMPAPTISLPQGGGAIRGIGETFGATPVTGTSSMLVPSPRHLGAPVLAHNCRSPIIPVPAMVHLVLAGASPCPRSRARPIKAWLRMGCYGVRGVDAVPCGRPVPVFQQDVA